MLKGVNRQVVEVSHPESAYFERVLFFVKPEAMTVNETRLKDSANALISQAVRPPCEKKRNKKSGLMQFLKLTAAAAGGAAVSAFFAFIS